MEAAESIPTTTKTTTIIEPSTAPVDASPADQPLFRPGLAVQRYRFATAHVLTGVDATLLSSSDSHHDSNDCVRGSDSPVLFHHPMATSTDVFIDAGCNVGNLLKSVMGSKPSHNGFVTSASGHPCAIIGLDLSHTALIESSLQIKPYEAPKPQLEDDCDDDEDDDDDYDNEDGECGADDADDASTAPSCSGDEIDDNASSFSSSLSSSEDDDDDEGCKRRSYPAAHALPPPHPSSLGVNTSLSSTYVALLKADLTVPMGIKRSKAEEEAFSSSNTAKRKSRGKKIRERRSTLKGDAAPATDDTTAVTQPTLNTSQQRSIWPKSVVKAIRDQLIVRIEEKMLRRRRDAAVAIAIAAAASAERGGGNSAAKRFYPVPEDDDEADGGEGATGTAQEAEGKVSQVEDRLSEHDLIVDDTLLYMPEDCCTSEAEGNATEQHPTAATAPHNHPLPINITVTNIELIEHIPPLLVEATIRGIVRGIAADAMVPIIRRAMRRIRWAASQQQRRGGDAINEEDDAGEEDDGLQRLVNEDDLVVNVTVILTTPNGEMNEWMRRRNERIGAEEGMRDGGGEEALSPWHCQYRNLRHNDHYFELKVDTFGALVDYVKALIDEKITQTPHLITPASTSVVRATHLGHISQMGYGGGDGDDGVDKDDAFVLGKYIQENSHKQPQLHCDPATVEANAFNKKDARNQNDQHDNFHFMCASHGFVARYSLRLPFLSFSSPSVRKEDDPSNKNKPIAAEAKEAPSADHLEGATLQQPQDAATMTSAATPFPFAAVFGSAPDQPTPLGDAADWSKILTEIERNVESEEREGAEYALLPSGDAKQHAGVRSLATATALNGQQAHGVAALVRVGADGEEDEDRCASQQPTSPMASARTELFYSFYAGHYPQEALKREARRQKNIQRRQRDANKRRRRMLMMKGEGGGGGAAVSPSSRRVRIRENALRSRRGASHRGGAGDDTASASTFATGRGGGGGTSSCGQKRKTKRSTAREEDEDEAEGAEGAAGDDEEDPIDDAAEDRSPHPSTAAVTTLPEETFWSVLYNTASDLLYREHEKMKVEEHKRLHCNEEEDDYDYFSHYGADLWEAHNFWDCIDDICKTVKESDLLFEEVGSGRGGGGGAAAGGGTTPAAGTSKEKRIIATVSKQNQQHAAATNNNVASNTNNNVGDDHYEKASTIATTFRVTSRDENGGAEVVTVLDDDDCQLDDDEEDEDFGDHRDEEDDGGQLSLKLCVEELLRRSRAAKKGGEEEDDREAAPAATAVSGGSAVNRTTAAATTATQQQQQQPFRSSPASLRPTSKTPSLRSMPLHSRPQSRNALAMSVNSNRNDAAYNANRSFGGGGGNSGNLYRSTHANNGGGGGNRPNSARGGGGSQQRRASSTHNHHHSEVEGGSSRRYSGTSLNNANNSVGGALAATSAQHGSRHRSRSRMSNATSTANCCNVALSPATSCQNLPPLTPPLRAQQQHHNAPPSPSSHAAAAVGGVPPTPLPHNGLDDLTECEEYPSTFADLLASIIRRSHLIDNLLLDVPAATVVNALRSAIVPTSAVLSVWRREGKEGEQHETAGDDDACDDAMGVCGTEEAAKDASTGGGEDAEEPLLSEAIAKASRAIISRYFTAPTTTTGVQQQQGKTTAKRRHHHHAPPAEAIEMTMRDWLTILDHHERGRIGKKSSAEDEEKGADDEEALPPERQCIFSSFMLAMVDLSLMGYV